MASSKRTLGLNLLACWLILHGLTSLANLAIPYIGVVMAVVAIVAGVVLLLS